MIETIHHRGPDDTGFFMDTGIGLANARLSIIDIEGGHQPIQNETGTIHVTYNGEIYNYRELRQELEQHGHKFATKSDTEVIVHGYEEFGESFVTKLNGMFAIALWDSSKKKLVLARDRMGIKPLYYTMSENTLLFASEMKSILQAPLKRAVDVESLYAILNLGYVPGDRTLLHGIRKLLPSNYLVFQNETIRVEKYWTVPHLNPSLTETETLQRLDALLGPSIRDQLVADVPIGCFLSGGLDTGTIVAYASKASTEPLKTFCMGFGEETDEFEDARLIAERFGTDHRELLVDSSQAMKLYPKMIWHMEAPKYNLYPWFVCELVHKYVKVCLSGNGGDEVFGGYFTRYRNALRIQKLASKSYAGLLKASGQLLQKLPNDVKTINRLRVLESLGDNVSEYLILAGVLPDSFNSKLFKNGTFASSLRESYSPYFDGVDLLQGLMNAELRTKLVDDLLSVDDTMSMAHSVELRVPLLDNRIVDLMTQVPWRLKYAESTHGKLLLRKVVRNILPEESLHKPKWGFSVNVQAWFNGELGEMIRQTLPGSDVLSQYFNIRTVDRLVSRTSSTDKDRRLQVLLWQMFGFHLWHRIFVENDRVGSAKLQVEALVA
jgi:asparagine synthase (glutamine-hydrolysing)